MKKNYMITAVGLLSTSMTMAGCTEKTETEEESVNHDSIASNWSATSMFYSDMMISLPSEDCMMEDGGTYCYGMEIGMVIDESQAATITVSYTATLDDVVLDDESYSASYTASVVLKDVSNSYGIILDDEDEFFGSLDCTLSSDTLSCTVANDDEHQITFSR